MFPPKVYLHMDYIYHSSTCHSIMYSQLFTRYKLSYSKEIHSNFSMCRYVANTSLRFLSSLFYFWKMFFAAYRILGWQFYFSPTPLSSGLHSVWWRICCHSSVCFSIDNVSLFFGCLWVLFFTGFQNFMICFGGGFLYVSMLRVYWVPVSNLV